MVILISSIPKPSIVNLFYIFKHRERNHEADGLMAKWETIQAEFDGVHNSFTQEAQLSISNILSEARADIYRARHWSYLYDPEHHRRLRNATLARRLSDIAGDIHNPKHLKPPWETPDPDPIAYDSDDPL